MEYRRNHKDVRQGWIGVRCPWCGGAGEYYLGININGLYSNCWRCGPKRTADVIATLTKTTVRDVIDVLRDLRRTVLRPETRPNAGKYRPPRVTDELLRPHAEYLRSRGFDPAELVALWDIGAIGTHATYSWRILIPATLHGTPVSWTSRAINPENPVRYKAADPDREAVSLKDILYGADYCRHACIVHEGPLDVWRIGPGAVALNGTGYTTEQVNALTQYAVRVIAFDNEPEAQQRASALADVLSVYPGDTFKVTLDSPDPGSATKREIRALRRFLK